MTALDLERRKSLQRCLREEAEFVATHLRLENMKWQKFKMKLATPK